MLHATSVPLRLITGNAHFEGSFLCIGPLPKGWMAKVAPSASTRTAVRSEIKKVFGAHAGTQDARLIGRYSGKVGGPIILYLEFRTSDSCRQFYASARSGLHPEIRRIETMFAGGGYAMYSSTAPAEALELLKEKELLELVEVGRKPENAWPLPPPAPPPTDAALPNPERAPPADDARA